MPFMVASQSESTDHSIAVVTGRHPFDVPEFVRLFDDMSGITAYHQDLENFVLDWGNALERYDCVVFYHFHQAPDALYRGTEAELAAAIEAVGDHGQGIVVLHHALVAFPGWNLWTDVCGLRDRDPRGNTVDYHKDIEVTVNVTADHPITDGIESWEMVDEVYEMRDADDDPENEALFAIDHPKSVRTVGWTRMFRNSRVFSFQSGHGGRVFRNLTFREVLDRGIRWSATGRDARVR